MIFGYASLGYEGVMVSIEVDMTNSIPALEIVGLPSSEVKEARERVKIAIRSSGFNWPSKRILVNLSPADIKKKGAGFDLPIALAILEMTKQINTLNLSIIALGELQLNGRVRPVPHGLSAASCGLNNGVTHFIVAPENRNDILVLQGAYCYPVSELQELKNNMDFRLQNDCIKNSLFITQNKDECRENVEVENQSVVTYTESLADLSHCDEFKRVIQVAAAGRHNLYLCGPPGTGKTAAAVRLPSLLPPLNYHESIELSKIYACSEFSSALYSNLNQIEQTQLVEVRPVRMPHHTASAEGMIGSATRSIPGEISLAHTGVLILDEAPEFKMQVLQSLREPMDCQFVHISRAGQKWECPSDFQLVLTSNLCPCGNLGKSRGSGQWCLCSEREIFKYWKRIGGAVWDRIDMKYRTPFNTSKSMESIEVRISKYKKMYEQVQHAIYLQRIRYSQCNYLWNARCPPPHSEQYMNFSDIALNDIQNIIREVGASERGRIILSRVSRTIADLENSDSVNPTHVEEAKSMTFMVNPSNISEMIEEVS